MRESSVLEGSMKSVKTQIGGLWNVDVRAKLILTAAASIAAIALSSIYAQLTLLVFSFIYVSAMKRPKIMAIAYGLILFIAVLAMGCILIIDRFAHFMEGRSYFAVAVPFMRMVTMVNVVLPLAFTSRPQGMLTALKSFRLPFFIYLPVAVMIRFIPSFINDIKQIAETMRVRGVEVSFFSFAAHPALMARYIFMPLLFRSLRSAEELGIAAELKGLGLSDRMIPYKKAEWKTIDTNLVIMCAIALGIAVLVQINVEVPESLRSLHR